MKYLSVEELPSSVRSALPVDLLPVYLNAFNNAWKDWTDSGRTDGQTREDFAHEIAMSAATWPGQHRIFAKPKKK